MSRVLLVEDDADTAIELRLALMLAGHQVAHAKDGRSGLRDAYLERPELVVLDLGLPGMDGWQVLQRLRDVSDVPVLLLAAPEQEADRLAGGADGLVAKPFSDAELVAKVETVLRRSPGPANWASEVYDDGLLRIDPASRRTFVDGDEVRLTPTEYRLLTVLVRHPGAVLSANQLLAQAWDDPAGVGTERIRHTVLRLQRKLGWAYDDRSPIELVPGLGYRYRRPEGGGAGVLV